MAETIRPLYDRVLLKRVESEQTSSGGIIIPDTAQEKTQLGEVISTGDGKILTDGSARPMIVTKGDTILFGKYSGTEVEFEGAEYLILKEDEILGIVRK